MFERLRKERGTYVQGMVSDVIYDNKKSCHVIVLLENEKKVRVPLKIKGPHPLHMLISEGREITAIAHFMPYQRGMKFARRVEKVLPYAE